MGKLICPICGDATSPTAEVFEAKVQTGDIMGWHIHDGRANAITPSEPGQRTYGIMKCNSCNKRFVAQVESDEWVAVYPIPTKRVDLDIDEPMKGEFEEAQLCFAVGAYRACVCMCGTALEAVWHQQKASGLLDLKNKGVISHQLYERADEVRLWDNIAKHELVPNVVNQADAEQLLTYVEAILNAVYAEPKRLSRLAGKREELKKSSEAKNR
jgi:hypothetical protein